MYNAITLIRIAVKLNEPDNMTTPGSHRNPKTKVKERERERELLDEISLANRSSNSRCSRAHTRSFPRNAKLILRYQCGHSDFFFLVSRFCSGYEIPSRHPDTRPRVSHVAQLRDRCEVGSESHRLRSACILRSAEHGVASENSPG